LAHPAGSVTRAAYRHLYNNRAWRKASKLFLLHNPLCADCARRGITKEAGVTDHIVPHKGDPALFSDPSNWQPLCFTCHNAHKQSFERTGRVRGCDEDGRPLDANHPWNRP
jgi:5-methylcytosine-specific restriction protein A